MASMLKNVYHLAPAEEKHSWRFDEGTPSTWLPLAGFSSLLMSRTRHKSVCWSPSTVTRPRSRRIGTEFRCRRGTCSVVDVWIKQPFSGFVKPPVRSTVTLALSVKIKITLMYLYASKNVIRSKFQRMIAFSSSANGIANFCWRFDRNPDIYKNNSLISWH